MFLEKSEDVLQGMPAYFNWGLTILKSILPTDISPQKFAELSQRKDNPADRLIREFLDASTCFVSKQYMKDPQLKYITSYKEKWFSCVLLGDRWTTVIKGLYGKELNKKLNKANCIIFDFTSTDGECIDIVLKDRIILSKEHYYTFKNDIIDKFGLKIVEYKPEGYDPNEGNLFLEKTNLTITCDSSVVKSLWNDGSIPYWLFNALDWDTVDIIRVKIAQNPSDSPFSIKSILNKIVIYPDCPTDWRVVDSGAKALNIIENQIGKTICNFFIFLTISGEGEIWYPLINSAIERMLNHWKPFLDLLKKANPGRLYEFLRILYMRHFALPEGLTIRANSEYKFLLQHFFIENNEQMIPCNSLIIPASEDSLQQILNRIGDPGYVKLSISIFKEILNFIKEELEKISNKYQDVHLQLLILFVEYLGKNMAFLEELNSFYESLLLEMDTKSDRYLMDTSYDKFDKVIQYLIYILLSEKDISIRQKILAFITYRNKIFDVVPDIHEQGYLDDKYLCALLISELKKIRSSIPEYIIDWAEAEKIRAENKLGQKRCSEVITLFESIEKSISNILHNEVKNMDKVN